jgi:hypothetical protein
MCEVMSHLSFMCTLRQVLENIKTIQIVSVVYQNMISKSYYLFDYEYNKIILLKSSVLLNDSQ